MKSNEGYINIVSVMQNRPGNLHLGFYDGQVLLAMYCDLLSTYVVGRPLLSKYI